MTRRLVMVHAHPDDESIATGGTLAHYAAAGAQVTLVTCTLGEEGEIIPAELRGLGAESADQLGGYRHTELTVACAALGVADHRYLGGIGRYRDSGMAGSVSAEHPRALVRAVGDPARFRAAVAELAAILHEVQAQVVVGYAADGGYGHPDHISAHRIARAAAVAAPSVRRFFTTVRPERAVTEALGAFRAEPGYQSPTPDDLGFRVGDDDVDVRVDVRAVLDQHRKALGAHATQVDVLPSGFALSNRIAQPILDVEYFQLLDGDPLPADGPGDDFFAGWAP